MENALDAIKMAFGMMVFVIAMSAAMYLFNTASSTAQVLLYYADKTNYYDNVEIINGDVTTRIVDVETIIPTLYRYFKENFAVQIYDASGNMTQIFDVNIEGKLRRAAGTRQALRTGEQNALISLYGDSTKVSDSTYPYLFEAPWIGNTSKDIKTRVDLYVRGECGYINGTRVDYRSNNLKNFQDRNARFREQFSEYAYKGDTITSEDGTETITGNAKTETKIVIVYQEI